MIKQSFSNAGWEKAWFFTQYSETQKGVRATFRSLCCEDLQKTGLIQYSETQNAYLP